MVDLPSPPLWLQAGTYSADNDRSLLRALVQRLGVVGAGEFAVSQNGTPNMSVNVASGRAFVPRTSGSNDYYLVEQLGTVNLSIAAADPTNPRIDIVVATVYDATYSGSLSKATFEIVQGTPGAVPSAPATPFNSTKLAEVRVNAGVTSVLTANITDKRTFAASGLRRARQGSVTDVGITVELQSGPTGDALQVVSSTGTVLGKIDSNGNFVGSDTGWVTAGFTAQTGWSNLNCKVRKINSREVHLHVEVSRTGAAIVASSVGNFGNSDMVQIPAGFFPPDPVRAFYSANTQSGGVTFNVTGMVAAADGYPTATINTGDTLFCDIHYFLA